MVVAGQPLPTFTATVSGVAPMDSYPSSFTGSFTVSSISSSYVNPGQYPITVTGNLANPNYTVVYRNGALTVSPTGPAPANGTSCNGAYTGTFNGNITVAAGEYCEIDGGTVNGNLTSNGGTVVLINAKVTGNVQISGTSSSPGARQHVVCGSTVQSNLQFQNDTNPITIGGTTGSNCGPNTIAGNLQLQNNSAAALISVGQTSVGKNLQVQNNPGTVTITSDTTGINLQVTNDTGGVTVSTNKVGGDLQVQNDSPSTAVASNTVTGKLQCSGNAGISGSGNTAAQKQGQCAAF
jgi:MBG domain (YGX type)